MSDRHKTKAELLQEMERLRTDLADIQRIAKLGFWRFDIASSEITWSAETYQLFGLEPHEFSPSYDWLVQTIQPEFRELHQSMADKVIATGKTQTIEYAITRADASTGWIWARIEAIIDDRGQVNGLQGVAMDISDRKMAEIALRESEARFRNLFESNIVGMFFASNQGEIFDANDRFLQMIGFTKEELDLGLVHWDRLTPPEYDQKDQEIIACLRNHETPEPWQKEYYRKDGSRIPVLVGVASIDVELEYTVCIVVDMTEQQKTLDQCRLTEAKLAELNAQLEQRVLERTKSLQENEDRLKLAFNAANMGYWDLDLLTNGIVWSESLEKMMGLKPGSFDGDLQKVAQMMHPDDRGLVLEALEQSIHNDEPYDLEFRFIKPDGTLRWTASQAIVIRDQNNVPLRVIGVDVDVTRRKQFEEELQKVNQVLEERLDELKQRNAEMLILSGITDYLQSCFTVKDACGVIAALAQPLFPGCDGGIFILSPQNNCLERVTFWGNPFCSDDVFTSLDCWALRRGRSHEVKQGQHALFCSHVNDQHLPLASLCIPLIAQGETLGLLFLCTFKEEILPDIRQQLAKTVAEQLAMAIANLKLREQLEEQSIRDPLTKLFNRRYLEQRLTQELARAKRHHYSVGVLMIDVDHFKHFNDSLGHDAGDRILAAIGTLLKNNIRTSDVACRYGGEEITIILPDATMEEASQKAEFLRQAIAEMKIEYSGKIVNSVTASFGVACYPDHGETGQEIIQIADKALYDAKQAGRNRVIVAPKEVST
ncbi:sensor domain-containing diguanylate cyclase [Synechocystis sp. CACIAM 05]|uniref:sensor domain-containing diguanylate cyclase n=1 Tax=Synechocystis sp. CACIAM 05 TaxID=1933929 RepID=UPI00138E7663|nr:diguanylate cyclase [Synechocystis sp. CACIAM 05]QHV01129.1 diguanylate cyclase [Synechocystis sp. CACIAM 05]